MAIECPHCACKHSVVRNTENREVRVNGVVKSITRRIRVCMHCKLPFPSVEVLEHEQKLGAPDSSYVPGPETLRPQKPVVLKKMPKSGPEVLEPQSNGPANPYLPE